MLNACGARRSSRRSIAFVWLALPGVLVDVERRGCILPRDTARVEQDGSEEKGQAEADDGVSEAAEIKKLKANPQRGDWDAGERSEQPFPGVLPNEARVSGDHFSSRLPHGIEGDVALRALAARRHFVPFGIRLPDPATTCSALDDQQGGSRDDVDGGR
ncbi:MAG: hypothetical protein Q8L14_27120 [Myxococcales bacterium]|nr:hypothetical protein [Myxococcales bacterium]